MLDLDVHQLKEHLESAETPPLLLDVRQPWEYETCKLEDSMLLPMGLIPSKIHTLDKERETVLICHHGIRSRQVGFYLEQSGFTNVINMKGGIDAWAKYIDNTMATY